METLKLENKKKRDEKHQQILEERRKWREESWQEQKENMDLYESQLKVFNTQGSPFLA